MEWYYQAGIVAFFDHDRLAAITLHTYTGYQGFVPNTGTIERRFRLADNRQMIIETVGTPTKAENGELLSPAIFR